MNEQAPTVVFTYPDAFVTGWMGATKRIFQIAEAFQVLGFETVLISNKSIEPLLQAEIDAEFPGPVIRTKHSGDYPAILDITPRTRRLVRAFWKICGQQKYWQKMHIGWADRLDLEYVKNTLASKERVPDLVWGISSGFLDGARAGETIANAFNIPCVVEFHDPPRHAGLGKDIAVVRKAMNELLGGQSTFIVTSNSYGEVLTKQSGVARDKWRAIHLTYDDAVEEPNTSKAKDMFKLVYVGTLHGDRSIDPIIRAIHRAVQSRPEMKSRFRLEVAGKGSGFERLPNLLEELNLDIEMGYMGALSRDAANRLVQSATATIVVQTEETALCVPGKVYECLQLGMPVLGVMPINCEAADILRRSGLGFIHSATELEKITSSLIFLWDAWVMGETVAYPNTAEIQNYSSEMLPVKIENLLKTILPT